MSVKYSNPVPLQQACVDRIRHLLGPQWTELLNLLQPHVDDEVFQMLKGNVTQSFRCPACVRSDVLFRVTFVFLHFIYSSCAVYLWHNVLLRTGFLDCCHWLRQKQGSSWKDYGLLHVGSTRLLLTHVQQSQIYSEQ